MVCQETLGGLREVLNRNGEEVEESVVDKMGNTIDVGECLRFARKHWMDKGKS